MPLVHKAFLSSTYEDLRDHRARAIADLRRSGWLVDPMEDWTADPREPKEFSQERIKGCDVLILLVARRRGHRPDGEDRSITELEYWAARELGIEVLVFALADDADWRDEFDERAADPHVAAWRAALIESHGVEFFDLEPASLEIAPSLSRWQGERAPAHKEEMRLWNVPFPRNPAFIRRGGLLEQLDENLTSGKDGVPRQIALTGLGGIGKTQLAVEYSYHHASDYAVVWWVRSEESMTLVEDLAELAHALGLPQTESPEASVAAEAALGMLQDESDWLLVFDNAPSLEAVRRWLPTAGHGHVVITSRDPEWGNRADSVSVREFERAVSVDFLVFHAGDEDRGAAGALADELGDLPLALEQAAAFIRTRTMSLDTYLTLYRERGLEMRRRRVASQEYQVSVAATLALSLEALADESFDGAALLWHLAFVAPDQFPISLLVDSDAPNRSWLGSLLADPLRLGDATAEIRRYSLAQMADDSVSVHRMVQAVVRDQLTESDDPNEPLQILSALIATLNLAFPFKREDPTTWTASGKLLPHVLRASEHAEKLGIRTNSFEDLTYRTGGFLLLRTDFGEARHTILRGLDINEIPKPDDRRIANLQAMLGQVLFSLGDFEGADTSFRTALSLDEQSFGPNHHLVLRDLNNLGLLLRAQRDLEGARSVLERSVEIMDVVYGPEHPPLASGLSSLGLVLQDLGDLAGARKLQKRALAIREACYPPDHPDVAHSLGALASVLTDLGGLEEARRLLERSLAINEGAFGLDHLSVGDDLAALAELLEALGDLEGAREALERAIKIGEERRGPQHPYLAADFHRLAHILFGLDDQEATCAALRRELAIREAVDGPDPVRWGDSLVDLGHNLLEVDPEGDGACRAYERALKLLGSALGHDHPRILELHETVRALRGTATEDPPHPG